MNPIHVAYPNDTDHEGKCAARLIRKEKRKICETKKSVQIVDGKINTSH